MKNKRIQELLHALAKTGRISDLASWSELAKVSKRTIQNDLQHVSDLIMSEYHLALHKVKGDVYELQGAEAQLVRFQKDYQKNQLLDVSDTQHRQLGIMKKLLIEQEVVTTYQLSEEYFVSRSSIAGDIKQLKRYFNRQPASLTTDHLGTAFDSDEYDVQEILRRFILGFTWEHTSSEELLRQLYNYFFEPEVVAVLLRMFEDFLEQVEVHINERNVQHIQAAFVILICRGLQKHPINRSTDWDYAYEQLQEMTTYFFALNLGEQVQKNFDYEMTKTELMYLSKLLMATGVEPISSALKANTNYQSLIEEAIFKMSVSMGVSLEEDERLRAGLATHIIPMIYRIQNNIHIKNPLLGVIKSKYSVMYGLTWFVMMDLERELAINLSEDEVAFIMVHFQAAIERKQRSLRVLFVCPNGYGTSSLLAGQVRQILANVESYETLSLKQMAANDLSAFDFIISTIPLAVPSKKVVKVSPILTQRDVKNILETYGDWFIEGNDWLNDPGLKALETSLITDVLQLEDIYVEERYQSKAEVLDFLCSELEQAHCVTAEFRQSIFGRESLAPTNISNGVAVPHGNPNFVKQSKVKIFVNLEPLAWGEEAIDVVIMLAINKEDVVHVESMLMRLFKLIYDRQTVEAIFVNRSRQAIYQRILLVEPEE